MTGSVDVLAVMEAAPSVTVAGKTVLHNTAPWRVATNRHPETNGDAWGWVEGAPGHVCWSNSTAFNRAAAQEMVAAHERWLEDQKSMSIRLVEARARYSKAKLEHDLAKANYLAKLEKLEQAELEIIALAEGDAA